MTTAFTRRALTGLLLLSIVSPLAAFADDHDNWRNKNRNWNHQNYKQVQKYQKKQYQNYKKAAQRRDRSYWRNHWGNNWNDQRDWYQHNFNNLQARSANERQRQLRAKCALSICCTTTIITTDHTAGISIPTRASWTICTLDSRDCSPRSVR